MSRLPPRPACELCGCQAEGSPLECVCGGTHVVCLGCLFRRPVLLSEQMCLDACIDTDEFKVADVLMGNR